MKEKKIDEINKKKTGHEAAAELRKQVESQREVALEALRESEERFRALYDNSTIGLYRTTPDGRIHLANPALVRMLGYSSFDDLSIRNLEKNGFEPSYPRAQFVEIIKKDGEVKGLEYAWKRNDGATIIVRESARAIRDAQGKTLYYDGIVEDISESKRSETERLVMREIMQGYMVAENLRDFLKNLHVSIAKVLVAENFFVALYNKDTALFEEIYSVDKFDPPALPSKLEKSISGYVFRSGQPLLVTQERFDELAARGEVELVGTNSPSWLGVPLKTSKETIGVMVVQDYDKENRYSEQELDFLVSIAGQIALVVERKQIEEALQQTYDELEQRVATRTEELSQANEKLRANITERKQVEEALRNNEEKFRSMTEQLEDIIYMTDYCGIITYISPSTSRVFGWLPEEMIGRRFVEFLPEDEIPRAMQAFQAFISTGKPNRNLILRMKRKDNSVFFGELIGSPLNKERSIMGTLGLIRDITERKRTETALRESEARYRTFFDTSRDCVFITSLTGRWLYMNNVALELFGYSNCEELSQINISDLYVHPEERAKCISITMERSYTKEFPVDLRRKDGAVIHALITEVPRYDANGNVLEFQGTIRDITEHRRAEEVIVRGKAFLDQLIETAPEAIIIADCQGRVLQVNSEFMHMFGYTSDEAIGKQVNDLVAFPECQEEAAVITESILQGKKIVLETMRRRKDGSIFDVSIVGAPINISGRLEAIYAIYRDISERKRIEEVMRASLAEKEVLLKEVHHRVKNNLMIIIGLIKMQETKAANEMFNPLLHELEGRIRSMAQVHEGLYKSADLAHVDLQNYIETMSAQIHAQFGADRDIRFSVQAAGVDVTLDIAVPCGLILNELLTNAFKHAFPGDKSRAGEVNCEINVIVNQEGGMNKLIVTDNGVGLPADLDWEKSDTLGLRLIKMLSKQINGSLELDRSAGTVFRLKFPMAIP